MRYTDVTAKYGKGKIRLIIYAKSSYDLIRKISRGKILQVILLGESGDERVNSFYPIRKIIPNLVWVELCISPRQIGRKVNFLTKSPPYINVSHNKSRNGNAKCGFGLSL